PPAARRRTLLRDPRLAARTGSPGKGPSPPGREPALARGTSAPSHRAKPPGRARPSPGAPAGGSRPGDRRSGAPRAAPARFPDRQRRGRKREPGAPPLRREGIRAAGRRGTSADRTALPRQQSVADTVYRSQLALWPPRGEQSTSVPADRRHLPVYYPARR